MHNLIQVQEFESRAFVAHADVRTAAEDTPELLEKRLRSLGCPEDKIARARRGFETRTAQPTTATKKPAVATTVARKAAPISDVELKRRGDNAAAQIAADERRDKAKQAAQDARTAAANAEQKRKDDDLAERMKAASGRTTR